MKKAITTLIIVFVLVLVVLPLLYIAFGKLRNPIEAIGERTAQQTFANQNYIPESADAADPRVQNPNDFNYDLEKKCAAASTLMKTDDLTLSISSTGFIASSTPYRFTWQVGGAWEWSTAGKYKADTTKAALEGYPLYLTGSFEPLQLDKYVTFGLKARKYNDPACTTYYNRMYSYYHDSGRYLTDYNWESIGFLLREKGLITINGVQYYWYGFDDTKNAYVDEKSGPGYYVEFNAFKNGIEYSIGFEGFKNMNTSYRNIVNISTQYTSRLMLK